MYTENLQGCILLEKFLNVSNFQQLIKMTTQNIFLRKMVFYYLGIIYAYKIIKMNVS